MLCWNGPTDLKSVNPNPVKIPNCYIRSAGNQHKPLRKNCFIKVHPMNEDHTGFQESSSPFKELKIVACGLLATWTVTSALPVVAASQSTDSKFPIVEEIVTINADTETLAIRYWQLSRLPPLSTEPDRCEKAFVGNTIGQANGVYDKPIDLRFCDYTNDKSNLKGKSLAAALMSDAKFDGADISRWVVKDT
ncbi:hypothetical protein ACLOJK_036299 [Asimina triloba]